MTSCSCLRPGLCSGGRGLRQWFREAKHLARQLISLPVLQSGSAEACLGERLQFQPRPNCQQTADLWKGVDTPGMHKTARNPTTRQSSDSIDPPEHALCSRGAWGDSQADEPSWCQNGGLQDQMPVSFSRFGLAARLTDLKIATW